MTKQTLLVDADMVAFRACAATEQETDWGDGVWTLHGDVNDAMRYISDKLTQAKNLVDGLAEDDVEVIMLFSCSGPTFRHQLNPEYKANRKGTRKPVHYKGTVAACWETYECRMVDNLEADDLIGIACTNPKMFPGRKIVFTGDKDLGTIPGEHINLLRMEEGVYSVDELEARRFFYKQALMGDATDGYGGCPGIGPKTADKILDGLETDEELYTATRLAFKKAEKKIEGGWEEWCLLNLRMARILDTHHWDNKKKEAILWEPK